MTITPKTSPNQWAVILRFFLVALTIFTISVFCYSFHYSLLIPFLILFLSLYLVITEKADFKLLTQLGLLLFIISIGTHLMDRVYTNVSFFYIPVASAGMLTILLFNNLRLSFLMAIACSLMVSLILHLDFSVMMIFLLGSLSGVYFLKDARTRGKVITAGLLVSLTHLVCLLLTQLDWHVFFTKDFIRHQLDPLLLNGIICSGVVLGALKIFEMLFGVVTNFSLLELADFNHPLLKRMILEAPGTYHHSLVVSNLSEAAADSIGANALLTRVGGYYHDIGKMIKPEYFTENQLMGHNKHDDIEPSMSRLVILNHVTEGVELARRYKLNQSIIDFIPQHHGTSVIHYFYQRSLEEAEDGEVIDEGNFRYPGPKPQTRETAITMLADSVEGATRALQEPNLNSIEDTVKKVINNRFIDGQLNDCNLTLKDIEQISSTFVRVLTAMYHTRIKYPEKKNGNSNRKSSEKNPAQQQNSDDDNKNNS